MPETNITIYSFEDEAGQADTYSTTSVKKAQEYGERHGLFVIGNTYTLTGSSTAFDFTPKDRLSRLKVSLATLGHSLDDLADEGSIDPNNLDRFALIEQSTYDHDSLFVTTHETRENAANYHDGQECPDDWQILSLVCLDTGAEMDAETSTRFV